jgi:hypothetical protein
VCGADTRSCRNCAFYSPGSHYDCRETVDEAVRDKERANFCESFVYNSGGSGGRKEFDKAKKAKNDFAALFK